MTDRWAVERAVLASDLAPMAKLVLLVLLVRADARTLDTGRYSPSLTVLAGDTGMGRSTVARELDRLERDGWVERHRPPVAEARSKKARTRYVLRDPARGTEPPETPDQAGPTTGLVPDRDQASPTQGPDQSQSGTSSSPTAGHRSDHSDQGQISSQVIEKIISVLEEIGGKPIDPEHARKVARDIGPGKSNTVRFAETCIRNDPERYLPTPQPDRFTATSGGWWNN